MGKKIGYEFTALHNIFSRPEALNEFARERMGKVCSMLKDYEAYNCLPGCNSCCYGSILMSYTEFNYILLYMEEHWTEEEKNAFFQKRVGLFGEDEKGLLCPFLKEDAGKEHCSIYTARPLICRVFGTEAAPCAEEIRPGVLPESLFYQAYDLLYYSGEQFIALKLVKGQALYEAPFALWCLADNDDRSKEYLHHLLEEKKHAFNAVLYQMEKGHFFTLNNGAYRVILRRKHSQ